MSEKIKTRFQLFRVDGGRDNCDLLITKATLYHDPKAPRIVDLNVQLWDSEQILTYLGESRTVPEPDVKFRRGKVLGPLVTRNLRLNETPPLFESIDDGSALRIYPCSEDYEVYGVWAVLSHLLT